MSTSRVPSGVPTGGQFAASAHAESGVSLGAADAPPTPQPTETDMAYAVIAKMRAEMDRLETVASLVGARDNAREAFGDQVAYISVDDDHDDAGADIVVFGVYDADGNQIDAGVAVADGLSAIPDDLYVDDRHGKGFPTEHAAVLDLAALDRLDLAAEVRKGEMRLAGDAIGRNAIGSFVLDTDSIKEQIDAEMSFGTFNGYLDNDESLTSDEEAQVMAEFRSNAVDFEPVINDFHYETQRAVEAVLDRTRRGHE